MKPIKTMRQRFAAWLAGPGANQNRIALLQVKALYDAAYEAKSKADACFSTFESLLAKAEAMDAAYRAQLAADHARTFGKAA